MTDRAYPSERRTNVFLAYGLGSVASAAKSAPISVFLVIYYNQVVGLPAMLVASLVMVSLVFDAVFDPLIGQLSDTWRSRWGRRLPFMYASAGPLTMFFVALWLPPDGMPQWATATWLLVCLAGVRLFDTLFELPHMALVPEISGETHRRTTLYTVRFIAESIGGIAITALAYNYFLIERADGTGGVLSAEGYPAFAWFCGGAILSCILMSARGLQPTVLALPAPAFPKAETVHQQFQLAVRTLASQSFFRLAAFAILVSAGSGMGSTLSIYWLLYYYRFSQVEMSLLFLPISFGILVTALTPALARRIGKRNAAILFCWTYFAASALPLVARAGGWIAPASHEMLLLVAAQSVAGIAAMTMVLIVLTSMVSDLTEEAERRTGRRSEALLLSSMSFVRKATQGFGAMGAGIILTLVDFPTGAERANVGTGTLDDMATLYLGGKALLFALATLLMRSHRDESNSIVSPESKR